MQKFSSFFFQKMEVNGQKIFSRLKPRLFINRSQMKSGFQFSFLFFSFHFSESKSNSISLFLLILPCRLIGSGIIEINKVESITVNKDFRAEIHQTSANVKDKFHNKFQVIKERLVSFENSNFSKSKRNKTKQNKTKQNKTNRNENQGTIDERSREY